MFLHSRNMNAKKFKTFLTDLKWLMREKGRRKLGRRPPPFSYSVFVLDLHSGRSFSCLIGITAFLLECYMLPGNIYSTSNIPAALRTAQLNCSLFGNWVSPWSCLYSAVQFGLPENVSGMHISLNCIPVPSFLSHHQQWI